MVFSSPVFLFAFLPAVFLLYRLLPGQKGKNALLACASLVFYAFGQLQYVPLFFGSVVINYCAGLWLAKRGRGRKAVFVLTVLLNLGVLCLFKYTDFVLANLGLPQLGIILPIGISFYTFQGLSYVMDCYRDPETGTEDFLELLLYIAFFPQLIAGPIVKYHDIAAQIRSRQTSPEETEAGIFRFVLGLSKKLLVADTLGKVADMVFAGTGEGDIVISWLGAVCYTLQIYYDFSGYSDMAIGLGHMFGFTIRENFMQPYSASSLRDFWRRWHISLSSWFKEYLYIPLGGNRKGRVRTAINRLIVFLCTGIWHGANWTFVAWGLGHGVLSSLEDAGLIPVKKLEKHPLGRLVCRVYTMLSVTLLFVVFRADSLKAAGRMLATLFAGTVTPLCMQTLRRTGSFGFCLVLLAAICFSVKPRVQEKELPDWLRYPVLFGLLGLCVLSLAAGGFHPFLYFQF